MDVLSVPQIEALARYVYGVLEPTVLEWQQYALELLTPRA
jgi:hypothetical protein